MKDMTALPGFDALPRTPEGVASAWGVFGADDNVGTINLCTPERIAAASRLVRRGALFPLDTPVDFFRPAAYPNRGMPRHTIVHEPGTASFDDLLDNFYLQGSSQWDSLAHAGYGPDAFYNGVTEKDVYAGRNTIDHWAARGIAGRAVLLDMVATYREQGRPYDPGTSVAFSVTDLEAARTRAGVELQAGDILLFYTGVDDWYGRLPESERRARVADRVVTYPGLAHTEEICRYLWDHHVAAVASDTMAVEVCPHDPDLSNAYGRLHGILIGQLGLALGEFLWLRDLAADCARDGVHEFFLTSSPLHVRGGIGSTPNALAIK